MIFMVNTQAAASPASTLLGIPLVSRILTPLGRPCMARRALLVNIKWWISFYPLIQLVNARSASVQTNFG